MVANAIINAITNLGTELKVFNETKKLEIKKLHFKDIKKTYDPFMSVIFEMLDDTKKPSQEKLNRVVRKFRQDLIVWGGAESLLVMEKIERANHVMGSQDLNFCMIIDELLFAIRIDLGHSNKGIPKGSMVKALLDVKSKDAIDAYIKQK